MKVSSRTTATEGAVHKGLGLGRSTAVVVAVEPHDAARDLGSHPSYGAFLLGYAPIDEAFQASIRWRRSRSPTREPEHGVYVRQQSGAKPWSSRAPLPGGRRMADLVEHQRVQETRLLFQQATREQFIRLVENLTGREGRAFVSSIDSTEDVTTEAFYLRPAGS